MMLVRMVELLIGDPPQRDCLKYVCDHLLLPDLNEVKLVRGSGSVDNGVATGLQAIVESERLVSSSYSSLLHHFDLAVAANLARNSTASAPFSPDSTKATGVLFQDPDSDSDIPVFDVQPQDGRLFNSSYTDRETLFTWTDITGTVPIIKGVANLVQCSTHYRTAHPQ